MKLRESLKVIMDEGDDEHVCRPFCLYSRLADLVGADYCERDKSELLFRIDRRISLVKRLMRNDAAEVARIKKEFSSLGDLCSRREFDEILDVAASVLVKGYASPNPAEPNDFDYGFSDQPKAEEEPKKEKEEEKVEDHLIDESELRKLTVAQLRAYCRTHGIKGYSSLNKSQLINLILYFNRRKAPAAKAPVRAKDSASGRHHAVSFRAIAVMTLIAAVIAGVICLVVFAKQIQWYQWQHMIGAVGGLVVCGVGFLLSLAIGWFLNEIIVTGFDGYLMAISGVIAPLAIANFVLAFVSGEAYIIIFYWLSGYLFLASVIGTICSFTDYETASGIFGIIDAIAVGGMLLTQVLVRFIG